MIRLLAAVLFLIYSHFGWAMAYPEDYSGVPHGDFQEGEVIDHTKFNQNNLSIKEAINDRVPVPSNCSTDQIIKYDGGGWVCTDMPSGGGAASPELVVNSTDEYPLAVVSCPGEKKVTGGGCGFLDEAYCAYTISRPELDLSGWRCQVERSGAVGCRILGVWAICQ